MPQENELTEKVPNGAENRPVIKPEREQLPILEHAAEIKEAIRSNDVSIIVGETGSGKTTEIPLMLRMVLPEGQKVAITQPRRVAARSVARYVAEKAGTRIGEEIGYQVRFEDRTTEGTRVNFMTDGILLRRMQDDPLLREYSAVVVDEAHERSLNIDFTLGLLKRMQGARREAGLEPVKIVVTSATLEKDKFAQYFDGAPVVEVPGRLHPVDVHYEQAPVRDYTKAAADKVKAIIDGGKEGDILIFMPGLEEIDRTIKQVGEMKLPVAAMPLYGAMSPEDQDKIFDKGGPRKVIVSTNIAETSVTVPGVRHVVDSGLIKQIEYDHQTGIEALEARPHAKAGCIQRSGRAGRVAPGEAYRLYTEVEFNARQPFQTPEIQRSNLAHVVLTMKTMGIDDVEGFEFIDPPERGALRQAVETLQNLGALDENGKLTGIGEIMADLPLEPRIARMVIEADKHKCVETICTIAAFTSGRSVFVRPKEKEWEADSAHRQFKVPESDFLTLLKVWEAYEKSNYSDRWARDNFLHGKALDEVRSVRYQLFQALRRNGIRATENADPDIIGKCITAGLVENLMEEGSRHSYIRVRDRESGFFIHPSSATFGNAPRYFVPGEIVKTSKTYARVIQEVKPEWIREVAPQMIKEIPRSTRYDPQTDQVIQTIELALKGSYSSFGSEERQVTGEQAVEEFSSALSSGVLDMPFVTHNKGVMDELNKLYIRSGGTVMEQQYTATQLRQTYQDRLGGIASRAMLEKALKEGSVTLELNIDDFVPVEQRAQILRDNPDHVIVAGKEYNVTYEYSGGFGKRFTTRIEVTAEDLFRVVEVPQLPGGKPLEIKVVAKEGGPYSIASGTDLEQLKSKARETVVRQQYDAWKRNPDSPQPEQVEINLLGDVLPEAPEPKQFGVDPITGEPLMAYAAVRQERTWSSTKYSIQYFASEAEAKTAQKQVVNAMQQAKAEEQKRIEREEFMEPARVMVDATRTLYDQIGSSYADYGLTYNERSQIGEQLVRASYNVKSDPKAVMEALVSIKERLLSAIETRAGREKSKEESVVTPTPPSPAQTEFPTRSESAAQRLRIDDYSSLSDQEIGELQRIVTEDKNKDIGKWRLAVAALAAKGADGMDALLKAEVTDTESLEAVKKAMKKAQTEAITNQRADLDRVEQSVAATTKALGIYQMMIAANNHELVNGFLGNDQEARVRFKQAFYERLSKAEELPDINALGREIDAVLEEMTS